MAIIDTTRSYATRDIATGFSFGAFFSRMGEIFQAWNDARATRRALNALSDRELADIGLSRGDIESIVANGSVI